LNIHFVDSIIGENKQKSKEKLAGDMAPFVKWITQYFIK